MGLSTIRGMSIMDCIFCHHIKPEQIIYESKDFFIVFDINPIQVGHLLVISKQHYMSITEVPQELLNELMTLTQSVIAIIEKQEGIDGTTFIINNGSVMDDGVHFHAHLIPRYKDDDFWDNVNPAQRNISLTNLRKQLEDMS
jgi:histidine triad (HIT) family protein